MQDTDQGDEDMSKIWKLKAKLVTEAPRGMIGKRISIQKYPGIASDKMVTCSGFRCPGGKEGGSFWSMTYLLNRKTFSGRNFYHYYTCPGVNLKMGLFTRKKIKAVFRMKKA